MNSQFFFSKEARDSDRILSGIITGSETLLLKKMFIRRFGVRYASSLRLRSFALSVAHPQKDAGEDAYFIANASKSCGVADGVGGWSEFGIDSGAFAREVRCLSLCLAESLD